MNTTEMKISNFIPLGYLVLNAGREYSFQTDSLYEQLGKKIHVLAQSAYLATSWYDVFIVSYCIF